MQGLCYAPSMEPKSIGTALDLIEKASKALNSLREQAKTSRDAPLKENISNLYDHVLDLKEIVLRIKRENDDLRQENAELKRERSQRAEKPLKPEIRQQGKTNYYYVGDDGPYCQPCYDKTGKLVRLTPRDEYIGGIGRTCPVCKEPFIEGPGTPHPQRQAGRYGY
jgi:regulator of replication initiation timing